MIAGSKERPRMDAVVPDGRSGEEAAIVALMREFVDREVRPVVRELEQQ
jgi:hypothetical protein